MSRVTYTVPDKVDGDLFTEQMWDDYLKTNLNNLMSPPTVAVSRSTQMNGTASAETTMVFDTETRDTDDMYPGGSSSNITAQTTGMYFASWTVFFSGLALGDEKLWIKVDGNLLAQTQHFGGGTTQLITVSTIAAIAAGNILTFGWTSMLNVANVAAGANAALVTWLHPGNLS